MFPAGSPAAGRGWSGELGSGHAGEHSGRHPGGTDRGRAGIGARNRKEDPSIETVESYQRLKACDSVPESGGVQSHGQPLLVLLDGSWVYMYIYTSVIVHAGSI